MGRSTISRPISRRASSRMVSRVMPSRIFSEADGVISFPPRTMKMLQVAPSATCPLSLRNMASSKPLRRASSVASTLFTYAPQIFARPGIALSSTRRHEVMQACSPFSLGK